MVWLIGMIAPPPRPWTARNAISTGRFQATPQSTEPATNSPTPKSIIGLRPIWSASLP